MTERWAVVGGGMLGLTSALLLSDLGHDVTVYEAQPTFGGLAAAWSIGDVTWDRHYHVTLASDRALLEILDRLDLRNEMHWVETKTGSYADGALHSISDSVEFLRYPALRLTDKARLATTILYGARVQNWRKLEQVSAEDWLRRWSGDRTFDRFWLPLLRAKLSENYDRASAAFIWATIQRLYAARRSGMKREQFGYVGGGYARVLERFAEVLTERGVDLRPGSPVASVTRDAMPEVTPAGGSTVAFDNVIVAAASPVAARLIPGLPGSSHERLTSVPYQGIVCASVLLRHPLSPYYLTYITDPAPFTAVVEMSALVAPSELGGHALVYLPKYVDPADPIFDRSDDAIRAEFLPGLRRIHPGLRDTDILAFKVSRVRRVFPIPTIGYSDRVPGFASGVPGIHVLSSAQIVNGTLNVNETVELAHRGIAAITGAPRPTVKP
jgi:protoporphyrinogen oxidase